ncbi:MAG: hypothetical protein LBJ15_04455 [Comamonas sp.]|jgi:hypothetical protein|uniref:hypothetical protein n=1 Tax=Comamonas sp. TaxID=34028 RepID=UPI002822FAFC|nr:hypothetical protein [Comamonas sp.]MDR0213239.1 hypothetical protein [Comamonas sp.]
MLTEQTKLSTIRLVFTPDCPTQYEIAHVTQILRDGEPVGQESIHREVLTPDTLHRVLPELQGILTEESIANAQAAQAAAAQVETLTIELEATQQCAALCDELQALVAAKDAELFGLRAELDRAAQALASAVAAQAGAA